MQFGPTFARELGAAGLGDASITWDADGVHGRDRLTDGQNAILDAVIAAHNPNKAIVPASISPRQAKLALLGAGLLDQVDAAVAASNRGTQITWDYATQIDRDSPVLSAMAAAIGLTSDQIDQLFITGATL